MSQCRLCLKSSPRISGRLGVCLECIRGRPEEAVGEASRVHAQTREPFQLPPTSRLEAEECLAAAKKGGLTRVRLGNIHLLS